MIVSIYITLIYILVPVAFYFWDGYRWIFAAIEVINYFGVLLVYFCAMYKIRQQVARLSHSEQEFFVELNSLKRQQALIAFCLLLQAICTLVFFLEIYIIKRDDHQDVCLDVVFLVAEVIHPVITLC